MAYATVPGRGTPPPLMLESAPDRSSVKRRRSATTASRWGQTTPVLDRSQEAAVRRLVGRVVTEVAAELMQAALFGSTARGEARHDSDLDVLLLFDVLPPDREPQATDAERIAAEVASETGIPVTVWSVALIDCHAGNRTPMLVDALEDAIPVWSRTHPVPPLRFTPADALQCAEALLMRVEEGSREFESAGERGDMRAAARRGRDDVVRMCVAWLLLRGITRPRRAAAVRAFQRDAPAAYAATPSIRDALEWAAGSFGPMGRDEHLEVAPPPRGLEQLAAVIDSLRDVVRRAGRGLLASRRDDGSRLPGAFVLHPGRVAAPRPARTWFDPKSSSPGSFQL